MQSIKTSTLTQSHVQGYDSSMGGGPLVAYSFFQHQTIELIFSNLTTCPRESLPVNLDGSSFKQLVTDNMEIFGLFVCIFYVLSIIFVVGSVRRRNQVYEHARLRRESNMSDETYTTRKLSQSGESQESCGRANSQSQTNNQMDFQAEIIQNLSQHHHHQKSSSTTSSPGLIDGKLDKIESDASSTKKLIVSLSKSASLVDQQLVPYTDSPFIQFEGCQFDSVTDIQQRNSIDSGLCRIQEMVQIQGTNIRVKKELRVEVEKDPETQILRKIETQTIVTEIQATEQTEEQLKCMEERFQIQISEDKKRKGSKHQPNVGNSLAFRGLRMIEEENFVNGTSFRQLDVVNDWSKSCENGRFKKLFSHHELLGKGTYGEVYKALKELDQIYYAIKRIFFTVMNEMNLCDHRVFDEVKSLQALNHPNIIRYHTCWVEELEIETIMRLNIVQQQDIKKNIRTVQRQSSLSLVVSENNCSNDMVQFVGDDVESLKFSTKGDIKIDTQKESQLSFHPSDYSSSMESFVKRLQYNPSKSAPIFILCIEMEYCEKQTLKDFIDSVDRIHAINLVKSIFLQIAQGLAYIHEKELMHRDMKPANIFLTSQNVPKIGDFGLSRDYDTKEDQTISINPNSNKTASTGTPLYMAPEVRDGQQYGPKADVYALGIIYFELLQKMKTSHERNRLIKELTTNRILPPSLLKQYPEESKLILKMTSQKAENRPSSQHIAHLLLNDTKFQ